MAPGLYKVTADVKTLAEIGVALLLFTVGLEFSLTRIMENMKRVIGGGTLQVLISIGVSLGISYFYGFDFTTSLFYGFLFSLSSTAIVLKMCTDPGELIHPQEGLPVGVLLFQDICVVPMMPYDTHSG